MVNTSVPWQFHIKLLNIADAPVQLSELATMIQCDGRTQNGTTCRYNGMSIGMENDTKELAYGIFGTPENSLVFSCPLNLNWQCIPSYGGTSLHYNYRGFHSLGSSSKLNQYSFFIRSSWATDWICKQVINSKAQANPFGNLISSELASMLNQSGQNLGSPLASKLFFADRHLC